MIETCNNLKETIRLNYDRVIEARIQAHEAGKIAADAKSKAAEYKTDIDRQVNAAISNGEITGKNDIERKANAASWAARLHDTLDELNAESNEQALIAGDAEFGLSLAALRLQESRDELRLIEAIVRLQSSDGQG